MVADNACLADDRTGAMVHEKMRADACARVQVHAGSRVRPFRHDARNERHALFVQLVREPVHGDGFHARIGDDNFFFAERGGVAIEGRFAVGLEQFAHGREVGKKLQRGRAGCGTKVLFRHAFRCAILKAFVNLVFEPAQHGVHERGGFHLQLGGVNHALVKKSGKEQAQQIQGD